MEIEKLIKDTFTAHEHVAPDSDTVLATARERIDRKRAISRPLAVAAGVVAVTLAAAAVVVLNRSAGDDGMQAAAPTSGEVTATAPAAPAIADLTMPYTLGWLPSGDVEYYVHRINTGATAEDPHTPIYGGEYMLSVDVGGKKIMVDVQEVKMSPVENAAFKSGPGNPVTINGKRGVESANPGGPAGYEVYFEHPEAGSMYVGVGPENGGTADAQQLVDIGRNIAENITFPGTTKVTPSFGLGALPDGMRMCTFGVEKSLKSSSPSGSADTSYAVGTCAASEGSVTVSTSVVNGPQGTAGKPVQGHETLIADERGYRSLWILDAVGDTPILVAGKVPAADLYAIANGLVLPAK
ncbi:hypothetical protein [Actinophytocola sp. NPDC049390]|uniref:hypothetical protein n=1 Tax=Actinophytocola sp. NPDC049390 TaxID=3363894 RepID=UPI0037B00C1C